MRVYRTYLKGEEEIRSLLKSDLRDPLIFLSETFGHSSAPSVTLADKYVFLLCRVRPISADVVVLLQ